MVHPILILPDARLRQQADLVLFNDALDELVRDMIETCKAARGVGLAAPQIGVLLQVAVVRQSDGTFMELINPVVKVRQRGRVTSSEGCLSIPGICVDVMRNRHVDVTYQNLKGEYCELTAHDQMAVAYQHEIEHLAGKLFVDLLPGHLHKYVMQKYRERQRAEQADRVLSS